MTKTSYISITAPDEDLFYRGLTLQDRFLPSRLSRKVTLLSRKRKKGITQRSLLPQLSALWAAFSGSEKAAWTAAGAQCGLNGWRLFVQDQCIRIINDIAGVATPSPLHQSWVGFIEIQNPASEARIMQLHPNSYWVSHKVIGKKGMYEPILVTENIAFPIQLKINYSSDLGSVGAGSYAKIYAYMKSSYQGVDRYTTLEIPLDLVTDWKSGTATLTSVIGYLIGYVLYIACYNVRGTLFFDNIQLIHSGQNWVRDPYCHNIAQTFTRAFFQIPDHWAVDVLPNGASYGSIYTND